MGNIDQNQFQPINTNNKHGELQGNNIARNEAIPNGEAQTEHPLSTYTMMKRVRRGGYWQQEMKNGVKVLIYVKIEMEVGRTIY